MHMNNKYCPNCGNELPKEANFCPYCMTKLIAEDGTEIHSKKKISQKKLQRIIGVEIIVIICILIAILLISRPFDKTTDSRQQHDKKEQYTDYLGVWYDKEHKNSKSITETGGKKIEICKVDGENIVFSITSVSRSIDSKTAHLDYLKAKLKNGQADFVFSDDGFKNSGVGTIYLKEGNVHANIRLNSSDTGGSWDISMDTEFVCVQKYKVGQTIDIDGILDKYENEKIKLGERTDVEYVAVSSDVRYTFESGITIDVVKVGDSELTSEPYIRSIYIDYERIKSAYKYCYKGVDNTCNKEKVKELLKGGEFWEDGSTYTYKDEENLTYANILFDSKGYVESIEYAWWK